MSPDMKENSPESSKRAYTTPQMFEYGALHEITLAVGARGALDGARSGSKKTSL
jgi:hypothetical protein